VIGRPFHARLIPEPGEDGHRKSRRLFPEKYGLAHVWIAMIQDGSGSILVRAEPLTG
jgi:hypothetical protein